MNFLFWSPQPPLILGIFLPPLPQISLSLRVGVWYTHCLFSLHFDQLRLFCVNCHLLQEVSLIRDEGYTLFCVSELLLAVVLCFIKIGICTEQPHWCSCRLRGLVRQMYLSVILVPFYSVHWFLYTTVIVQHPWWIVVSY